MPSIRLVTFLTSLALVDVAGRHTVACRKSRRRARRCGKPARIERPHLGGVARRLARFSAQWLRSCSRQKSQRLVVYS